MDFLGPSNQTAVGDSEVGMFSNIPKARVKSRRHMTAEPSQWLPVPMLFSVKRCTSQTCDAETTSSGKIGTSPALNANVVQRTLTLNMNF